MVQGEGQVLCARGGLQVPALREGETDRGTEFPARAGNQAQCELGLFGQFLGKTGAGRAGWQPSPLSLPLLPEIKSEI